MPTRKIPIVVAIVLALGSCSREAVKSRQGESCARTSDCAEGLRCLSLTCTTEGADPPASQEGPRPSRDGDITGASPEAFSRGLLNALKQSDSETLRKFIVSPADIEELAGKVAAAGEGELGSKREEFRHLQDDRATIHDKLRRDARKLGIELRDLEFAGIAGGRVKVWKGIEIISPDLVIRTTARGRDYYVGMETCLKVSRGWVIADREVAVLGPDGKEPSDSR